MRIKDVDTYERVLVIAEIGNNHEGDIGVAQQLVHEAAAAGADAVKFQTFQLELFVHPGDSSRYERMRQFELSQGEFRKLQQLAHSLGLLFISTPLDLESARFLSGVVDAFKIASGDNNFYPLLDEVADSGKPVIISSGASDMAQMRLSKEYVESRWHAQGTDGELAVLHCVSNYPTADEDANLAAIKTLADELGCEVGYSDHTLGIDACCLSVALGAKIVEKHFTLDKNYSDFRDHQLAADPPELKSLVEGIRRTSIMLGDPEKRILPNETEMASLIRRSIVAVNDLPGGHRVTHNDLMWLRPGNGVAPGQEDALIGKVVTKTIPAGEPIQLADVA